MATEIKVPTLGESVTEATVAKWFKSAGDPVAVDEPLVELETDKVTLEVNAAAAGTLGEIIADTGANVEVGAVLGMITDGQATSDLAAAATAAAAPPAPTIRRPEPEAAAPSAPPSLSIRRTEAEAVAAPAPTAGEPSLSPSVRKLVEEKALDPAAIPATGPDGRLTKGDVLAHLANGAAPGALPLPARAVSAPPLAASAPPPAAPAPAPAAAPRPAPSPAAAPRPAPPPAPATPRAADAREERVRMTRLRQRIAERLKEAQNTAAMLTTFNEVDMTNVMAARAKYRDQFEKKHGLRLGFMSFFVKACIVALKEIPAVNAEIDGDDIVYKNYYDIGVAVGTEQGLVVPVLRDADTLSFAGVEGGIAGLGQKARDGKLSMDELTGGTFTITNGGVYGSLMSTPILNPPQSGILGMHKIQKRPMVVGDKVDVRAMMYLALSYDHRVIDGREAVTFLVRVKECLEDPERIMLDV